VEETKIVVYVSAEKIIPNTEIAGIKVCHYKNPFI